MKIKTRKNTIFVCMLLGLLLIIGTVFYTQGTVSAKAETETLEQKIVRFTNSDLLDGEANNGETIQSFAVKYKTGFYRPNGYDYAYPVTNILSKVIPMELFHTEGTHVYMGKEYGFVVITVYNAGGTGFQNHLLLIDFNLINEDKDPFD